MISRLKELVALMEQKQGTAIQLTDIADSAGLDLHTVSRWMKPEPFARIEVKTAQKLARYLGVTFNDMFVETQPTQQ